MRIIAEIQHPKCRISIFHMNMKYIIKMEKGNYEQTFKVLEMDLIGGLEEVKNFVQQDTFIDRVVERFEEMNKDFKPLYT
jgi:hypothetical protein